MQTDQDIEWKFVRSKLYMEYIRGGSPLPVPFNIIPAPHSALALITAMYRRCRRWKRDVSAQSEARTPASGGADHSPIYTTRPNGTITKAASIPVWQVTANNRLSILFFTQTLDPNRDLPTQEKCLVLPERRYASAGTSYGHVSVSVCLSVTSWSSIESDERIGLVFGMRAYFYLSYTVL